MRDSVRSFPCELCRPWTAFGEIDLHPWPKGGAILHHCGQGQVFQRYFAGFLNTVIDLFRHQIVGWPLPEDMTNTMVIDALRLVWFKRSPGSKQG
jgi:hypothetical protein